MDHAVSLVQTYLQLNGYFTAAEFPVVEIDGNGGYRTLTDLDILAFRFPTLDASSTTAGGSIEIAVCDPDPALGVPENATDMIIAEVKEGRVDLNLGVTNPDVLRAVLSRFGWTHDDTDTVRDLIDNGASALPNGRQIRLVAFGGVLQNGAISPCRVISLAHVFDYMQEYMRKHWQMLKHVQFKDPAFGFLMTMEKARRGGIDNGRRVSRNVGNGHATAAPERHVKRKEVATPKKRRRPKGAAGRSGATRR